jgi:ribonuclease HI
MMSPQSLDEFTMQAAYEARASQPTYVVNFDGCSKGNPGAAGAGAVLYENGREIQVATKYVGDRCTNNEAEWMGLLLGLALCTDRGIKRVKVLGDSQLVIRQIQGLYEVRHPVLSQYYSIAKRLLRGFDAIEFDHVPRAANARADELSNLALQKKE